MTLPEPIYASAVRYCGDPKSHKRRGELIHTFLYEQGLRPHHHVLNVGCGALSEGAPLIRYLDEGHFVGMDPNQWLMAAALEHDPGLLSKQPHFVFSSDFDPGGVTEPFDYVVAHSLLSHVAFWQLQLAFTNLRKVVKDGAQWLASLRLDQYTSFDTEWQYPGVSTFAQDDLRTIGHQTGWHVQLRPDLKERLIELAPNDTHDWVVLTATLLPETANRISLDIDERRREHTEIQRIARDEYARREQARLDALAEELRALDILEEEPEQEREGAEE